MTECPYCGTRLRKRAPKLERVGDELSVQEDRKDKRRRKAAERRSRLSERRVGVEDLAQRQLAPILVLAASAILVIVERASSLSVYDLGAIVGPVDGDWWRYLAAPFVYDDIGYLFACGLAIAIFLPAIERRVGTIGTLLLVLGCGSLGMLAADGLDTAFGDGAAVAAGGNGVALGALAAWVVIREGERRADRTEEYDWIAVAVAAAVLLALPLVEDLANPWAGIVGGLVGAACGFGGALGARSTRDQP